MDTRYLVTSQPLGGLPPSKCKRPISGSLTYEVFGWYPPTNGPQIWLLVPMTLMNLASLAIFLAAIKIGGFGYRRDLRPMDTRYLLTARVGNEAIEGDKKHWSRVDKVDWEDRVRFLEAL